MGEVSRKVTQTLLSHFADTGALLGAGQPHVHEVSGAEKRGPGTPAKSSPTHPGISPEPEVWAAQRGPVSSACRGHSLLSLRAPLEP